MNDKTDITTINNSKIKIGFNVKELVPLLNHECIRKKHKNRLPRPSVEIIGIVCGILTMNSEVELLVQFPEGIEQLCKTEFKKGFQIIKD